MENQTYARSGIRPYLLLLSLIVVILAAIILVLPSRAQVYQNPPNETPSAQNPGQMEQETTGPEEYDAPFMIPPGTVTAVTTQSEIPPELLDTMDQPTRDQWIRFYYNENVVKDAIQRYYNQTGQMPGSMQDLYTYSQIPANLVNPVTDVPLYQDRGTMGPGGLTFRADQAQNILFSGQLPDGSPFIHTANAPVNMTYSEIAQADSQLFTYWNWMAHSVNAYYQSYGRPPTGIQDMTNVGYWPFNNQINPITGQSLSFSGTTPGTINLDFTGGQVLSQLYLGGGNFIGAQWPSGM